MNALLYPYLLLYYWHAFAFKYTLDAFRTVVAESQHNYRYYRGK